MEFNFDLRRLLLLAVLLGGFAFLGGFTAPKVGQGSLHQSSRVQKAWSYCVVLFLFGAASATIVEHTVGYIDPTNLRPAYIVLGVLLMIASIVWLRSLKQTVESPPKANGLASCSPGLREALPWESRWNTRHAQGRTPTWVPSVVEGWRMLAGRNPFQGSLTFRKRGRL